MLPQSTAELTRLRDDVYAFRYLNHVSLFVPTDEGVVVVDPIGGGGNPQAPVALKGAIASITSQPVKYLIYSHAAADHSTGGAVFADTATFVSHTNAKAAFEAKNDPTSPVPTVLVEQMMPIDLGGKHFELHWSNLTPQNDYLIFSYPAQKVIMTVDLAASGRWRSARSRRPRRRGWPSGWRGWTRRLTSRSTCPGTVLGRTSGGRGRTSRTTASTTWTWTRP